MVILAGTALLAFGGRLVGERTRALGGVFAPLRLVALAVAMLALPPVLAPATIGLGWLMTLTRRRRGDGWDLFALGCSLYGRGLLAAPVGGLTGWLCLAAWGSGWAATLNRLPLPSLDGRRLRWELRQSARTLAPDGCADGWRIRAADALTRAATLASPAAASATRRAGRDRLWRAVQQRLCLGAVALGAGASATAREDFDLARRAVARAAGRDCDDREEIGLWLELTDWCEYAATLIDEEAPK